MLRSARRTMAAAPLLPKMPARTSRFFGFFFLVLRGATLRRASTASRGRVDGVEAMPHRHWRSTFFFGVGDFFTFFFFLGAGAISSSSSPSNPKSAAALATSFSRFAADTASRYGRRGLLTHLTDLHNSLSAAASLKSSSESSFVVSPSSSCLVRSSAFSGRGPPTPLPADRLVLLLSTRSFSFSLFRSSMRFSRALASFWSSSKPQPSSSDLRGAFPSTRSERPQ